MTLGGYRRRAVPASPGFAGVLPVIATDPQPHVQARWATLRADVLRRVQAAASRPRRARDRRLARVPRPGGRRRGRQSRPLPDVQAAQACPAAPRRSAAPDPDPLHQHDQPRAGAVLSGRRDDRASDPPDRPLERGGHGPPGEQPLPGHRRPPVDLCLGRQPLRGRLQPLLPGQGQPGWGSRRPGLLPGPCRPGDVRPGLPRRPAERGPARSLPARVGSRARVSRRIPTRG